VSVKSNTLLSQPCVPLGVHADRHRRAGRADWCELQVLL